ncbi:MAG TPA: hypothetical protein VIW70_00130 [Rubrivivax sp.]
MTKHSLRTLLAASALAAAASGPAIAAEGLVSADWVWPRVQARVSLGATAGPGDSLALPSAGLGAAAPRMQSASIYGDYYFNQPLLAAPRGLGGFRATSGLLYGAAVRGLGRPAIPGSPGDTLSLGRQTMPALDALSDDGASSDTLPYVGIGYTRLSVNGGWGFSADVGMVSENPGGTWRFGRALLGPQNLDDAVRNLRLAPLVQFDVRYAF